MKYVWVLFAIYFTALLVLPCSDNVEYNLNDDTFMSQDNKVNHNHSSEQCSPFCTCACCGRHINQLISVFFSKANLIFNYKRKEINFYSFVYNKNITISIWQPPKIS